MGLFSSDYKAYGSVSVNQIGEQRDEDDTFIGDLIIQQQVTGRNMADEIRHDLFNGVAATFRRYNRISLRNGFDTFISTPKETDGFAGTEIEEIKKIFPDAIEESGGWGEISGYDQALALASASTHQLSINPEPDNSNPGGWFVSRPTGQPLAPVSINNVTNVYAGGNGNLFFDVDDGWGTITPIDSGISTNIPVKEGYFTIVVLGTLASIDRAFYYFTTNPALKSVFEAKEPIDAYGCVSLQDNDNNENPYFELKIDPLPVGQKQPLEYQRRVDTMDVFGVNFDELSEAVFAPPPIPAYPSDDWDKDYGNLYNDSPELQAEHASEQAYHDSLVTDQNTMKGGIKNITDVHFGLFMSPKTLDVSNAYALKAFFKEILPGLPRTKSIPPIGERDYAGVEFNVQSGSLKISHSVTGYTFGRRVGSPSDYVLGGNAVTKVRHKGRVAWALTEQTIGGSTINNSQIGGGMGAILNANAGVGAIGIASVSGKTATGQSTYEFIEIHCPRASHYVDVKRDGEHGTAQDVEIVGTLEGIKNDIEPYSDAILYPLTVHSVKMTPFFLRERLMRESTMLIVCGIQVVEVKWYEQGIFQIIIMVVVAVVSCWLTACAGTAAYSLAGVSASAVISEVITGFIVGMVISTVMSMIDDPALAALFVVVAAVLTGQINSSSNILKMATLAVEATGTYMQKQFALEMIEMKEKMEELRKKYNALNEQMDETMKAAGMESNVNQDYALMKMTMPPPGEAPEDFFDRTLNRDYAIIHQDEGVAGVRDIKLPKTKH